MSNGINQNEINFDSLFANVNFESDDKLTPETTPATDSLDSLDSVEQNEINFDSLFSNIEFETDAQSIDELFSNVEFESKEEIPKLKNLTVNTITENDNFVQNEQSEILQEPSFVSRFSANLLEGLNPIPSDLTSQFKSPETLSETVATYSGQIVGFGAGLWATGGIVGGLKIIGTGAKATKALKTASNGFTQVEKLRKQARIAKSSKQRKRILNKAARQEELIDESLSAAGVVKNNTLLAKQEFYKKFITRIGADDYGVGKFLSNVKLLKGSSDEMAIRAANALDLGVTNIAASSIMFQKAIPLRDEDGELIIADRITKPIMDGMLLSLGGMPRVLGGGKIGNLVFTSKSGKAVEAPFVFATGVGASQLGLGIQGEGERTLTDNLLDGAVFTAAHYIGVGADNMRVKQAVREGLSGVVSDPKVTKKINQAMNDDALDKVKLYLSTKRPEYLRRRFIGKKDSKDVIQMTSVKETKNGQHIVAFTHLMGDTKGTTSQIQGTSRQDALKQFYNKYRSAMPTAKTFSKRYMEKNPNTLKTGVQLQKRNPDAYIEHQKLLNKVLRKEEELGIGKKESYLLKRNAFKKSAGNPNKMTMEELSTYDDMLRSNKDFKDIRRATLDNVMPFELPNSFFEKKKNLSAIRKFAYSYEQNLQSFGAAGTELARRVVQYADLKNITRGQFDTFISETKREFLPSLGSSKQFNSITAIMDDPKLKLIADDATASKIKDSKVLKKRVRDFFDETFVALAREDVKIQTSRKKFNPLLQLYNNKGDLIKVSDKSFDNGDVFKILRRKGKSVIDSNGKKVIVDVDKSLNKSTYVENYVPRFLSEQGSKLLKKDKDSFESNLRAAISINNKDASQNEIDAIVGSYISFADTKQPLGILNTRKIDIPPYMLIEKGSNRLIQIDELPHISNLKKGMSIKDIDGQSKVIGDVIEIYEKDFGNIIRSYAKQVSNSMALFRSFDEKGASGKTALTLLGRITGEAGATQSDYAESSLRLLLEGQSPTFFSSVGDMGTKAVANLYLSGGSAAVKNYLTGTVQNVTSFGIKNLFKSYGSMLSSPRHYKVLTDEVGAISRNVDELAFTFESLPGKAFSLLSAPFRAVERLNRRASVAITDVAMRDSFKTITGKSRNTLFRNSKSARQALKDGMSLDDNDIDYMIGVINKRKKYGNKAFSLSVENDRKFRELYKRGLYKSQASTQGVTQLPYIPTWMAKNQYKPLTLFYRTAYRVTENTYNKALVPFVRDGNPFPFLKYAAGSTISGKLLYDYYYGHALGKELADTNFKKVPLQYFDYAVRGEGLGFFGNMFDEYGDATTAYIPVQYEFGMEMINTFKSLTEIQDSKILVDWGIKNTPLFSQAIQAYKNHNKDVSEKFAKQKRLQRQFLDAYPQFKTFENRSGLEGVLKKGEVEANPFYYELLSESLIQADTEEGIERFKNDFIKTRAFAEMEKAKVVSRKKDSFFKREIRDEVFDSIQKSMTARLRPYPEAWDEARYDNQIFAKQYMKSLRPEQIKNIEELKKLFENRMKLLDDTQRDRYNDYYGF